VATIMPVDNPVISLNISHHVAPTKLKNNYITIVVGGKANPVSKNIFFVKTAVFIDSRVGGSQSTGSVGLPSIILGERLF
jgi:hypothetical protein